MSNRLPYETIGGNVSESITYTQLLEHLRLGAEAAYTLGHIRKANDDEITGTGFLGIGQLLERACDQITKLATNGKKIQ